MKRILILLAMLVVGNAYAEDTSCLEGMPYTKDNDQACQEKGLHACWNRDTAYNTNPWVAGKISGLWEYSDCTRVCAVNNTCWGVWPKPEHEELTCKTPDSPRLRAITGEPDGPTTFILVMKTLAVQSFRDAIYCEVR